MPLESFDMPQTIDDGQDLHPTVRYVSRYRGEGVNGWRYETSNRHSMPGKQVYFTVTEYGCLKAALDAAQAYSIAENNGAMSLRARAFDSRSPFEFCGVSLKRNFTKSGAVRDFMWAASWTKDGGRPKVKKYSIRKYGYNQAFFLAASDRIRAVGVQPNLDPNNPPEPPEAVAVWLGQ